MTKSDVITARNIRVRSLATTLEDGSEVYDVLIGDQVCLHTVSFEDACELVHKIRAAINEHTLETA